MAKFANNCLSNVLKLGKVLLTSISYCLSYVCLKIIFRIILIRNYLYIYIAIWLRMYVCGYWSGVPTTTGNESVLAYITTMGKIFGWDLRSQEVAWKLSTMPKYGKTAICHAQHIMCAPCRIGDSHDSWSTPELASTWYKLGLSPYLGHEISTSHPTLAAHWTWRNKLALYVHIVSVCSRSCTSQLDT